MKKLLSAIIVVVALVSVSESASYRAKVASLRGTPSDSASVTLKERIDYSIKENCNKVLSGVITKSTLTNQTQFTEAQLTEFCLRGVRGNMIDLLLPAYTSDATINSAMQNSTDAQLDGAFMYVVWIFAKLIGTGVL
jgi:hypothetical protein